MHAVDRELCKTGWYSKRLCIESPVVAPWRTAGSMLKFLCSVSRTNPWLQCELVNNVRMAVLELLYMTSDVMPISVARQRFSAFKNHKTPLLRRFAVGLEKSSINMSFIGLRRRITAAKWSLSGPGGLLTKQT